MSAELLGLIAIVVIALAFDYTNGFHDAANAIATAVSTRALTPRAALVDGRDRQPASARSSPRGSPRRSARGSSPRPRGASAWSSSSARSSARSPGTCITWYFGLPSSSSHALIGGLVGAALAASGDVQWDGVLDKVVIPMILSPLVGFGLAYLLMLAILWGFRRRNPHRTSRGLPARRRSAPPPRWRSATACRTRRRRWASSCWPW